MKTHYVIAFAALSIGNLFGTTELDMLIKLHDVKGVQKLLDDNKENGQHHIPNQNHLMEAIMNNDPAIFELLYKYGARFSAPILEYSFFLRTLKWDGLKMVETMLKNGCIRYLHELDKSDELFGGESPLFLAVWYAGLPMVKLLISYGGQTMINKKSNSGLSPLLGAVTNRSQLPLKESSYLVALLLYLGADLKGDDEAIKEWDDYFVPTIDQYLKKPDVKKLCEEKDVLEFYLIRYNGLIALQDYESQKRDNFLKPGADFDINIEYILENDKKRQYFTI